MIKPRNLFEGEPEPTDKRFLALRDDPDLKRQRRFLEHLWERFRDYADRQFVTQIRACLAQRFWEMYLGCELLNQKLELTPKPKTPRGPDFRITRENDGPLWIEAMAPNPGCGASELPQPPSTECAVWVPENEFVLRYAAAMKEKAEKRAEYLAEGVVSDRDPFVIALNSCGLGWPHSQGEIPYCIQAVLPFGLWTIYLNRDSLEVENEGFQHRTVVLNKNQKPVFTTSFLGPKYEGISGILFSSADPVFLPENPGEEFFFLHNPNARNPLPKRWFRKGREFWFDGALRGEHL